MNASSDASGAQQRRTLDRWLPLALIQPLLLGAVLRLWKLPGQILAGDELHGVRAALADPIPVLLTTYRTADPCLPLSAFYRWLMDRGWSLSELDLRLPVVVASLLAVVLLPMLVRREVGRGSALAFGWLLAVAPPLVVYGRMARPYGIVVLLAGVAVLSFYRWWRPGGDRRWIFGAVYAVTAPLAVYFHLPAAPFVAAPFVFALGDGLHSGELRQRWRGLVAVGAGALAGIAAFALPARESLAAVVAAKQGASQWSAEILGPVAQLLAATDSTLVTALFWIGVATGLVWSCLRNPRFAAYTATLVAIHLLVLWWSAPFGAFSPLIVARYLLVILPLLLIWLAVALAELAQLLAIGAGKGLPWPLAQRAAWTAVAVVMAGWLLQGPMGWPEWRKSNFLMHDDLLRFHQPPGHRPEARQAEVGPTRSILPEAYRRLVDQGSLLEYPFRPAWRFARAPYLYQREHGRWVRVAMLDPGLCDERLSFTNAVCPRPEEILASPSRYLIVHLDLRAEEDAVAGRRARRDVRRPGRWQVYAAAARRLAENLEQRWGRPTVAEEGILIWNLDDVRARRGRSTID
ncbi:MAG: glycosyltransferase family 39 protein [Acidobacteriota bacterium]|nr:glycosyltransferase family 39 protein [Acidobacteriota bacterium]